MQCLARPLKTIYTIDIWCRFLGDYGNFVLLKRPHKTLKLLFIGFIEFSYLYAIKSPIRGAAVMNVGNVIIEIK